MSAQTVVLEVFRDTLGIEVPTPRTDLIDTGLLDSLAVVTLVFELEQRTGIQIPFEALDLNVLRSVETICDLMARLEQGAA